jgi:hypothetical protein
MSQTKIGFDQLGKPAPLGYRRFTNAYIVCICPALTGLFAGWGFSDAAEKKIGLVLVFSMAVVKGVGMVLGNGQVYSPSDDAVDSKASSN